MCPREPILLWEMAVWLVRVLDGADPEPAEASRFGDVDAEVWWSAHVERLAELEVTLGCSQQELLFCPRQPTTRAQMAAFLHRAINRDN